MKRREFVGLTGFAAGALFLPSFPGFGGNPVDPERLLEQVDPAIKKRLADAAMNAAKSAGATYADVRIGRYLNQSIFTREKQVQNIGSGESYGAGVRVLANGTWGFAATNTVTEAGMAKAAQLAVQIAKANSKVQKEKVQLAPQKGYGDVTWKTPIQQNAFEVPIAQKVELLLAANAKALENGASFVNSSLFQINEQKYFASTDGSYIDQDIHRIWPTFSVTAIDRASGKFRSREALSAPMGLGYEYLTPKAADKIAGPTGTGLVGYKMSYDMLEDAALAAQQAKSKLTAKSVVPGKYDVVLDPNHLGLTIHESVGHATELDRVLGYEANYAGTSFATLDKWKSKNFQYGSKLVNIVADKLQPGSLGAVGYDDEGVKTGQWDLIKNGVLVDYQKTRDQAGILGQDHSDGCSYAQSWQDVQFQRMANVSLQPGKEKMSVDDMIKNVDKGVYIAGRGSYSIDQQRYNFQFGGTVFYAINKGKIDGMLEDVAYQANTQEFWNSCAAICDQSDYRLFGSFFDGKGQPSQVSAVSHGSSTTRFNGVNVINTARKIG
ncbi:MULTISPECIES: TldD/PmbA family protein [Hymenobacter]|uniref:TldD/PmbA family protein n=1 Tax=Hymenobacter jejuensis TaxID=2502781 RepID=A0A5B7ZXK1_9BACT|nr:MULTISPECIES: TldD/PmbA family protein [Hymenobacter]MBC6991548.1 TldD/PmbA family protein [Hymenobacter sp. BT491]QDA59874.1 TldD/PmbA family protein [Hymenobacter jejuensis]